MLETLESVEEQSGIRHPSLDGPEFPDACGHIWEWFCELSNQRQSGMNGPQAISDLDLYAWSHNTGRSPNPWEISAIRRIDLLYRKIADEDSGVDIEEV